MSGPVVSKIIAPADGALDKFNLDNTE